MINGQVGNRELFAALSRAFTAEVKGVFSGGIYLFSDSCAMMLHDASYGVLPFGIAVNGFKGKGKELGVEAGMTASLEDGILKLSSLEIKLFYTEQTERRTTPASLEKFITAAENTLKLSDKNTLGIYSRFGEMCSDKASIDDLFALTAYSGMSMLHSAMSEEDGDKLRQALMKLIGLGRGLTPSCDDFITGAMFMLSYAETHWSISTRQCSLLAEGILALADERTNIYSALYLKSAARGGDFSILRECIEMPDGEAVSKLCEVGSSSGTDMLCGMLFAAGFLIKMKKF